MNPFKKLFANVPQIEEGPFDKNNPYIPVEFVEKARNYDDSTRQHREWRNQFMRYDTERLTSAFSIICMEHMRAGELGVKDIEQNLYSLSCVAEVELKKRISDSEFDEVVERIYRLTPADESMDAYEDRYDDADRELLRKDLEEYVESLEM